MFYKLKYIKFFKSIDSLDFGDFLLQSIDDPYLGLALRFSRFDSSSVFHWHFATTDKMIHIKADHVYENLLFGRIDLI